MFLTKYLSSCISLVPLCFTESLAYDIIKMEICFYLISNSRGVYKSVVFTVFNLIALVFFLLLALLQYNDPDPVQWIVIYLAAATMCLISLVHRQRVWLPLVLFVISLGWATLILSSVVGQVSLGEVVDSLTMKTRAVEEAREIGGLLLVALWAAIVWCFKR